MKSQKFQGEEVIKRQKSKGGPIKSLKETGPHPPMYGK